MGEASFQTFFNILWFFEVNKQLINAMRIKDLEGKGYERRKGEG